MNPRLVLFIVVLLQLVQPAVRVSGSFYGNPNKVDLSEETCKIVDDSMDLIERGEYAKATEMANAFLHEKQKSLDKDHPVFAQTLELLAIIQCTQKHYAEAEPLARKAYVEYCKYTGTEAYPFTTEYMELSLSKIYLVTKNYRQSEKYANKALKSNERKFGLDHKELVPTLDLLLKIYGVQDKYAKGEAHALRLLSIQERILGTDSPELEETLSYLAEFQLQQSKYAEAEAPGRRLLSIQERTLAADSPKLQETLAALTEVFLEQRKYAEAEAFARRLLSIQERTLAADSPKLQATLDMLTVVFWEQGKYAEAEAFARRLLTIQERTLGADSPKLEETLRVLGHLAAGQSHRKDAADFRARAKKISESHKKSGEETIIGSMKNLIGSWHLPRLQDEK